MKAAVTGAGGFCGSHLCRFLEAQGVEVHVLRARRPTVTELAERVHPVDPADSATIARALDKAEPDLVFHLAGTSDPPTIETFYRINVGYAASLLAAADALGITCPMLLVGSAAEYGFIRKDEVPIVETTPPRPFDHYGVSKLAQTLMGCAASRNGRPLVMVRPFNVIGPGMPERLAASSFARQIAEIASGKSEPVLRVGNLASSRDFVDVADFARIAFRLVQTKAAWGEIVNVCSGIATSLEEILAELVRLGGCEVKVVVEADRVKTLDVPAHFGSPAKLESLIGPLTLTPVKSTLRQLYRATAAQSS